MACQVLLQQNECMWAYSRRNGCMLNTELQSFIDEVGEPKISDAKVIELYDHFTSSIKSASLMDCRKKNGIP